jgi:FkbM family methyltransferase
MSFISYAQNFEDVMLWRALKSIKAGFWIDVGAAHPNEFSVTRAFYDRGWHGVNIEPEPDYAEALRAERPRDVNLQVAVAATSGQAVFHRVVGTGLSTLDATIAADHRTSGFPAAEQIEVKVTTLAAVCARHVTGDIHFLKIDAEGTERDVLLGADLQRFRPWIIVAEATVPGSSVPRINAFADVVIAAKYQQCWFDGLNAFFLAEERYADLFRFFQSPPNVFDNFVLADQVAATARASDAERRVSELEDAWRNAQAQLSAQEAQVAWFKSEVARFVGEAARLGDEAQRWEVEVARSVTHIQSLEVEIGRLLAETRRQEGEISHLTADIDELTVNMHRLNSELCAMRSSTSWRFTEPLRTAARLLGGP